MITGWSRMLLPFNWPSNICALCESLNSLKLESSVVSEIHYIYIFTNLVFKLKLEAFSHGTILVQKMKKWLCVISNFISLSAHTIAKLGLKICCEVTWCVRYICFFFLFVYKLSDQYFTIRVNAITFLFNAKCFSNCGSC